MAEGAMISLNARSSWTQKLTAIACCLGCFGKDAASWASFAPPAFLLTPDWLQLIFTPAAQLH